MSSEPPATVTMKRSRSTRNPGVLASPVAEQDNNSTATLSESEPQTNSKSRRSRRTKNGSSNTTQARLRARAATKTPKVLKKRVHLPNPSGPPWNTSMVGQLLGVTWPGWTEQDAEKFKCLVVGCAPYEDRTLHRVYYFHSKSMETLDLNSRVWSFVPRNDMGWEENSILGCRIVVHWNGTFDDPQIQQLAQDKYGLPVKLPYEAFVIEQLPEIENYLVLYTCGDVLEEQILKQDEEGINRENWQVLTDVYITDIGELPLVGWSGAFTNSELPSINVLTRTNRNAQDYRTP